MNRTSLLVALLVILFMGACSSESGIPSYLADREEAFKTDPRAANLDWFKNADY